MPVLSKNGPIPQPPNSGLLGLLGLCLLLSPLCCRLALLCFARLLARLGEMNRMRHPRHTHTPHSRTRTRTRTRTDKDVRKQHSTGPTWAYLVTVFAQRHHFHFHFHLHLHAHPLLLPLPLSCLHSLNWNFPCKYFDIFDTSREGNHSLARWLFFQLISPAGQLTREWIIELALGLADWGQSAGHLGHIYCFSPFSGPSLMMPCLAIHVVEMALSQRVVRLMQFSCLGSRSSCCLLWHWSWSDMSSLAGF